MTSPHRPKCVCRSRLSPGDSLLRHALDAAWFLHPSPLLAADVVRRAVRRLPAVMASQRKRLYYARTRETKLQLEPAHLLQQLVLAESQALERNREQHGDAGADDLLIWYVKHLVSISMRRNLFYVTLAVTRFLYGFETRETIDTYARLVTDPNGVPDESYYRSRKRLLLDEIRQRFEPRIGFESGARGETCIVTAEADQRERELVRQALAHFAPWDVDCADGGGDLRAVHILLSPSCLRRALPSPCLEPLARTRIPRFSEAAAATTLAARGAVPLWTHDDLRRVGAEGLS
jgi:hypothetical protein